MIKTLEYAKALFLIAKEDGATDEVLSDVLTVREILGENPEYRNLLDTPAVSKSERLALIDEAFSSLNESVKNLLKILAQRREVYAFPRIVTDFSSLVDEERGIVRAEAARVLLGVSRALLPWRLRLPLPPPRRCSATGRFL